VSRYVAPSGGLFKNYDAVSARYFGRRSPRVVIGPAMLNFRTPFFRSYAVQPIRRLIRRVVKERPRDFPKVGTGQRRAAPLPGKFGFRDEWRVRERPNAASSAIRPFEGGRLRDFKPFLRSLHAGAIGRLPPAPKGEVGESEADLIMSHAAADVIFRNVLLFDPDRSIQIVPSGCYLRSLPRLSAQFQPILNSWPAFSALGALELPRLHRRQSYQKPRRP